MDLWIARNEDGMLKVFKRKPHKVYDGFTKTTYWNIVNSTGDYMCLPDSSFPEVTFDNSPKRVELKLVEDEP